MDSDLLPPFDVEVVAKKVCGGHLHFVDAFRLPERAEIVTLSFGTDVLKPSAIEALTFGRGLQKPRIGDSFRVWARSHCRPRSLPFAATAYPRFEVVDVIVLHRVDVSSQKQGSGFHQGGGTFVVSNSTQARSVRTALPGMQLPFM